MQKKILLVLLTASLLAPIFATTNNEPVPIPLTEEVVAVEVVPEVVVEPVVEAPVEPTRSPVSVVSGDWVSQCHYWANLAGITLNDSAIKLIERESHCSPTARNPHSSAGGIPQALPWTKMGCALEYTDEAAVCQLQWMQRYVESRYGSWDNALAHSYSEGWY